MAGTRILILGFGREGVSLARFFARQGARVIVTDSAGDRQLADRVREMGDLPVEYHLGGDRPDLVSVVDRFFVSPGVPENNAVYEAARRSSVAIESMTTLFFDLCPGTSVGVTGSSGKTTTTGLIGAMLQEAGFDAVVGGNIGVPMLDILPSISSKSIAVLELSSFQLALLRRSPPVATVTNISPNHLDRHATMDDYVEAKKNIVAYQSESDFAVLNASDPLVNDFVKAATGSVHYFGREETVLSGATVTDGQLGVKQFGSFVGVLPATDVPLMGHHNIENAMAALAVADIIGVPTEAMAQGIRKYRAEPHRLEVVAIREGVRYIDDSIATSPARATTALNAIEGPILLIAGGRDKKLPWDDFARTVVRKARALFLIGEAQDLIAEAVLSELGTESADLAPECLNKCRTLEDAVGRASAAARSGDTVLLSPGCTSYDMFRDFEERGHVFSQAVRALHAA